MSIIKIVLLLVFISCNTAYKNNIRNNRVGDKRYSPKNIIRNDMANFTQIDIATLYGIKFIGMKLSQNTTNKDAYKKYSVDFTGACYSNDLSVLMIDKKEVVLYNYYIKTFDKESRFRSK